MVFSAIALAAAVDSIVIWRVATAADIDQIDSEHGAMAKWLVAKLPPGSFASPKVAVFDIGRMGYQVDGNLIDLGGLVDSDLLPYILQGRAAVYLREHGVRYVVLAGQPVPNEIAYNNKLHLDAAHGVTLKPVYRVCADPAIASVALESSGTAFPCQWLYEADYEPVAGGESRPSGGTP